MKGFLVRVGIDQAYGKWNAPVDVETGQFIYLPIPDNVKKVYSPGLRREYSEFRGALTEFSCKFPDAPEQRVTFPATLQGRTPHLDPDFEYLTYGDNGDRRGAGIAQLRRDDLLVFYAGLRPVNKLPGLVYALIGIFVIETVIQATQTSNNRRQENAHTRWHQIASADIVVRGQPNSSGRFDRCIPIGEFRDRAYRIRADLEGDWGGLSVKNGYIQRSAVPPSFCRADKFYAWFRNQNVKLLKRNNPHA